MNPSIVAFNQKLTEQLLTTVLKSGMMELRGLGVTLKLLPRDGGYHVTYHHPKVEQELKPEEALIQAVGVIWGEEHDEIMTELIGEFVEDLLPYNADLMRYQNLTPERWRVIAYRVALHHIGKQNVRYEPPSLPLLE